MQIIVVTDQVKFWNIHSRGVTVVPARRYLMEDFFAGDRTFRVFNLCRSYRYQSLGYYVSLLAAARGHHPRPSVQAIQEMKAPEVAGILTEGLQREIQRALGTLKSRKFTLSIYFGRNLAKRYEGLAQKLFQLFEAPLLRAQFGWNAEDKEWRVIKVAPIAASDIPRNHLSDVRRFARRYFLEKNFRNRKKALSRDMLAILYNPQEEMPPSNPVALRKFLRAARRLGFEAELIQREDYSRLAEYDALFIRETTAVNHPTYRFAQRAQAEGLVVVDDPESILRCSNKVYLAELLRRHRIPTPRTLVLHKDNWHQAVTLGFPVVLKKPDSSFSQGVVKVENWRQLEQAVKMLLEKSELIIAQEFLPTMYDWRVGVLDGKPLYVCKYYMAHRYWKIVDYSTTERVRLGRAQTFLVEDAPRRLLEVAVQATRHIGDGFYGVDLKEKNKRFFVIEVNDNPSIDAGVEDKALGDELYNRIMRFFRRRLDQKRKETRK